MKYKVKEYIFFIFNKKSSGSFTVEMSFIMPLILSCVIFILVMNNVFCDRVILDGGMCEILYADDELIETKGNKTLFNECISGRTHMTSNVDFSDSKTVINKTLSWNKSILPRLGILKFINMNKNMNFDSSLKKQSLDMSDIIRQLTKVGDKIK